MSRGTWDPAGLPSGFAYWTLTISGGPSHALPLPSGLPYCSPTTPAAVAAGLGSFPFARRYLGNRLLSFFSYRYLDVSVPCVRLIGLCIHPMIHGVYSMGVAPFGYLRIKDCLRLPEAFRSLPRPSSPLSAKASAICPFYLHLQIFLLRFFVRYAT